MSVPLPRVFRMAGWMKFTAAVACVFLVIAGVFPLVMVSTLTYKAVGVLLIAIGIGGVLDTLVSRIVLDAEEIHLISLVRHRRYPRADFESAKVDGGAVCLKRRGGGWVVLPGTGHKALALRNTVHAWITGTDDDAAPAE